MEDYGIVAILNKGHTEYGKCPLSWTIIQDVDMIQLFPELRIQILKEIQYKMESIFDVVPVVFDVVPVENMSIRPEYITWDFR